MSYWGYWVQICHKQPPGKYLSNETVPFQAKESSAPKLQATCTITSKRDHVNQNCGLTLLETLQQSQLASVFGLKLGCFSKTAQNCFKKVLLGGRGGGSNYQEFKINEHIVKLYNKSN